MQFPNRKLLISYQLLEGTIGIPIIEIVSNDFQEMPAGYGDSPNTYQKIVVQIKEEEPDIYAIGILYALSLMSFTYAAPRGYSETYFVPDEQWNLAYFVQGLEFRNKRLCFTSDYPYNDIYTLTSYPAISQTSCCDVKGKQDGSSSGSS